ncbi:MAG: lytic transglycosylase domain-containing protein [Clostridia bacterium]|nr:lytic transglycosylase domain-containing protein [Clostridia bacterium]
MKNKKLLTFIVAGLIVFVFLVMFKDKILKIIYPKTYKEVVQIYQEKYNIDENLIFALIKAESNFDNKAVSNRSAIGVMQLMEDTAKEVAIKNKIDIDYNNMKQELLNVDININIGTKYMTILLDKYESTEVALAAYNAGIGTVDNWIEKGVIKADGSDIENIPYKETNNYVRKILSNYKMYKELYK